MSDTQQIFVRNGIWYTGYEPHDMPNCWVSTRYIIEVIDGGGMLPDGTHQGMMTGDKLLCIKSGGEYYNGIMINHDLRDFMVIFDEAYHDEYYAGVKRGFKGRRACSYKYFFRQTEAWRDGYQSGLQSKGTFEKICKAAGL